MSTQRKLLAALLLLAGALAALLALALRTQPPASPEEPAREAPPAPRPELPAEPTEAGETRTLLPAADAPSRSVLPDLGPPVRIVGRIGDEAGAALEGVRVLVYDANGNVHAPEILRSDWYECTLHARGRTLVVAARDGNCDAEAPLELMPPDTERHIDLVLPAQPVLRIRVRDLEGKPLPRFGKGQPLRARLRAVASLEELPAQLPAYLVPGLLGTAPEDQLGWGKYAPESPLHDLVGPAAPRGPGAARRPGAPRAPREPGLPRAIEREFRRAPFDLDDETFDRVLASVRSHYKDRLATGAPVDENDPDRRILAGLGYIGADGQLIEGESPQRDVLGTLTLDRPLPLRVGLLAGQRVLETRDPVPGSEDLMFRIDFGRLREDYVHAWIFVSDAKSGARLPGAHVNLHAEALPGGPDEPSDSSRRMAEKYAGQAPPWRMGTPEGWRFPETDVVAGPDGRADFTTAVPGWCRLTVEAEGHVTATKWVYVGRQNDCDLGFCPLAPLATSRLDVLDPAGAPVAVQFAVEPLLHSKENEGVLEGWHFASDVTGALELRGVGRQFLRLRSADEHWAIEPLELDNTLGLVDQSPLHVTPARHVLLHLPAGLPWDSIVNVAQGLGQPVHERVFGGRTLIDLYVADGTYTLRVAQGFTAILTHKFRVDGQSMLVELAP